MTHGQAQQGVDQPVPVPADTYSHDYFLTECEGHGQYMTGRLPTRLLAAIELVDPLERKRVLDIGSGRGEVTLYCAEHGAEACGIDYSPDALTLAKNAQEQLPSVPASAHFQRADCQYLPFASGCFDVAFMLDIVEHLHPAQLAQALQEVWRILDDDGVLIVHTMPNLWYYRWGYPLFRFVQRLRGTNLPRDPRQRWRYVPQVHVNEQDPVRLRRSLHGARFAARIWLQPTRTFSQEENPLVRMAMQVLTRWYPFRWVFCSDIFALAWKRP
jgi:SAM-dependent methyltransferase